MPCRRGDGPGHARACRRAQEAAVRGIVADVVREAHKAHAAAQRDPTGSARAFLSEAALPAVRALNGARAPTLLSAMHRIVNAAQPGLISPEAALYGHWMEWRTSNRSGRPLSMGDTLRLMGAGSAMSLHNSAPALLHTLRTRCPGDTAPYLNQARATYPGGVSELDAALHLLHPPGEDLEVGEITVFVEGADEAPTRPRPTNPVYDGTRPTPPYAVLCEAFPREPAWCPTLPPATHAARSLANGHPSPPLSRIRGAHHRGQFLWQERPGTPLLLLVFATGGDPERVLGITPTHLYGAAPLPRPPLPAPAARDGVHTFLRTQEVTAITGVHLVRLSSAPPDDARGPRALSCAPDWELWRDVWAAWLTRLPARCRWMAACPRPHGDNATAGPPSLPPSPLRSTAQHCPRHNTDTPGGDRGGTPATTHAYQDNRMSDADGPPQRDDRHHRRSRSRSPVSPGYAGETLAEREERRLAEAAVPVGPPVGQPRAASADTGPSTRGLAPAEETAPAAQAASPAALPPEEAPGAQGAATAAPASRAAAPTAAPGAPPARGAAPARAPGPSPGAAAAAEESRQGARGAETAVPASCATAPAGHAATPSTPRAWGTDPARAQGASPGAAAAAAVGRKGAKDRAHANPTHTHTSPPKPFPPKPFPAVRTRHVRPPAPERSPPGVTLPQLRWQQDARRVIREGGDSAQAG